MLFFYLSLIDDESQRTLFEEIYTAYRLQMMYLAKFYLRNDADAEDVVHNVFLRIAARHMKFIQGLSNPDDIRNYLLKATKNTALNELNRRGRDNTSLESYTEAYSDNAPDLSDDSFIELLCAKVEYDRVVEALLSMGEPYRDIMYYYYVLDLSIAEASKLLGRNAATAKKQLARGRKLLINKLKIEGVIKNAND